MTADRICVVCLKENSSYKCPNCTQAYCSVSCCRQHKEKTQCGSVAKASPSVAKNDNTGIRNDAKETGDYSTDDTASIEKLESLQSNQELKSLLENNSNLQRLLMAIDRSSDPSSLLKNAMKMDSDFQRFSAICLKTVGGDRFVNTSSDRVDTENIAHLLTTAVDSDIGSSSGMQISRQDIVADFVTLLNDRLTTENSDVDGSSFFS